MSKDNKEYDMNTIVKDKSIWLRLLYMVLFAFLYSVAEFVILAVVVYQFLHVLITGGDKDGNITKLGAQLSTYVYQILQFQTFSSDEKPFPMADWPEATILAAHATKAAPRNRAASKKPAAKKAPAKKAAARKTTTRKSLSQKETPKADTTEDSKPDDTANPA